MHVSDLPPDCVARAVRGDPRALREIAESLLPKVHALAYRVTGSRADAEDVSQEAFLRLWSMLPSYDPRRAKLSTWLYRVTMNLAIDRTRRRREDAMPEGYDAADGDPTQEERALARGLRAQVRAAVEALPDRQRQAIWLSHFDELGNEGIAEIMGVSVEAVESLLARARRTLRGGLSGLRADMADLQAGGVDA